jgi:hypothetical protein
MRSRRLRMKKALFAAVVALFLAASLPLFAQTTTSAPSRTNPQQAYNKVVPLLKVWMHPLGYVLQFFTSQSTVGEIYVPLTWFNKGVESKADLVYGNERSYPYASIFWVDGKFDHVNIYVLDHYNALSWGIMETVTDRSASFNVEEVPRQF